MKLVIVLLVVMIGVLAPAVLWATSASTPNPARSSAQADHKPRFGWPLSPPPPIGRRFEAPASAFGPGHRGVDLLSEPGQAVLATAPGIVRYAGWLVNRPLVAVEHAGGFHSSYEPTEPVVKVGDHVRAGQLLGRVRPGHVGCPRGACLHWGVRAGEAYVDPLSLVRRSVRLFPLSPSAPHAAAFF